MALNLGKFTRLPFVGADGTLTREAAAELSTVKRVADEFGTLTAVDVPFTPAGGIAAANVQLAIEELETEKANAAATTAALAGKQPLDATLTALAGLATGADTLGYFTGADAASQTAFTALARTLVGGATAAAMRSTLGAGTGNGDVTGGGTASGSNTGDQFTAETASTLIGRGAGAGAGPAQEITVGTGLTMTGTTLSASGGGGGTGDVVGPASAVDSRVVFFDGTTGKLIKDSGLALSGANTGDQTITLTGDVTGTGTGSFAATVANDAVTYAKLQNVSAASKLLGRGDSGSGDPQEITLGTNLAMSGTTLNATAGSGAALVSAMLTATQTNSTTTPAVLTGHTFTLTPGQTLSLTGQFIFTADALTTGGCLGVRVAQAATADAHAIGSVAMQVAVTGAQGNTQLFKGDQFDVAANANSFFEIVGTATTAANVGSAYQLTVKNLSSNVNTTVTIEFRSEVATSVVTALIGTGCGGVRA